MQTEQTTQPTIGEVYNPLIEAALANNRDGLEMLNQVGAKILETNPGVCPDLKHGIAAARINLDYYCQYFPEEAAAKVKDFYGLGRGFRDLSGRKHNFE